MVNWLITNWGEYIKKLFSSNVQSRWIEGLILSGSGFQIPSPALLFILTPPPISLSSCLDVIVVFMVRLRSECILERYSLRHLALSVLGSSRVSSSALVFSHDLNIYLRPTHVGRRPAVQIYPRISHGPTRSPPSTGFRDARRSGFQVSSGRHAMGREH